VGSGALSAFWSIGFRRLGSASGKIVVMLHAYVDESYVKNGVYFVGALVVDPVQLWPLQIGMESILWRANKQHGVPLDAEFHGRDLFQRSGEWECLREKAATAHAIYRNALRFVPKVAGRVTIRGVDAARFNAASKLEIPEHSTAFIMVLERINRFAEREGRTVKVFADRVNDEADQERRIQMYRSLDPIELGYRRPFLNNIENPINWVDSREHHALQALDLSLFIYRRNHAHTEKHDRVEAAVSKMYAELAPALVGCGTYPP
jgi:hypothetical protein